MQLKTYATNARKCLSEEGQRYAMRYALLETGDKRLVATDGRRLVLLPVELDEHDTDGYVTNEALAAASKAKPPRGTTAHAQNERCLLANGSLKVPFANFEQPRPDAGNHSFPNYKGALPEFKQGDAGTASITFNAQYLADIAECLSAEGDAVTITFKLGNRKEMLGKELPILVTYGKDRDAGFGVLMPITVEN